MVAAADQWAYGGRPVDWAFLFSQNSLSRSITANDIGVSWGQLMALGKELFAGKIVPSPPLCRELPRQSLCQEERSLCREHLAHGTGAVSCSALDRLLNLFS